MAARFLNEDRGGRGVRAVSMIMDLETWSVVFCPQSTFHTFFSGLSLGKTGSLEVVYE